jgi:hypothetical protein
MQHSCGPALLHAQTRDVALFDIGGNMPDHLKSMVVQNPPQLRNSSGTS